MNDEEFVERFANLKETLGIDDNAEFMVKLEHLVEESKIRRILVNSMVNFEYDTEGYEKRSEDSRITVFSFKQLPKYHIIKQTDNGKKYTITEDFKASIIDIRAEIKKLGYNLQFTSK